MDISISKDLSFKMRKFSTTTLLVVPPCTLSWCSGFISFGSTVRRPNERNYVLTLQPGMPYRTAKWAKTVRRVLPHASLQERHFARQKRRTTYSDNGSGGHSFPEPMHDDDTMFGGSEVEDVTEERVSGFWRRTFTRLLISGLALLGGACILPLIAKFLSPLVMPRAADQVDTAITGESCCALNIARHGNITILHVVDKEYNPGPSDGG